MCSNAPDSLINRQSLFIDAMLTLLQGEAEPANAGAPDANNDQLIYPPTSFDR